MAFRNKLVVRVLEIGTFKVCIFISKNEYVIQWFYMMSM